MWNKLPDSWIVKGGVLLLSIIFTPIGLALSLALTLFLLALTLAALVLLTAVALIAVPIKWISHCFSSKKNEPLNCLDHIKPEDKTNEINERTPLLSKSNKNTQSLCFFDSLQQTKEPEVTEAHSFYQKNLL